MKVCSKCQIPQPLENFSNNKNLKNGKESQCKSCRKRWREENKNINSLKQKQWREENKDIISLKQKQYYEENKDISLLKQKQYYEENKKTVSLRHKRWYETPTGKASVKNAFHKRRAITKQGDVTTVQLRSLLDNATHCFYCNNPLVLNEIHIDHYMPLSRGGLHTISNLRVACKKCNLEKSDKIPEVFLTTIKRCNFQPNMEN